MRCDCDDDVQCRVEQSRREEKEREDEIGKEEEEEKKRSAAREVQQHGTALHCTVIQATGCRLH
jgi:hypothetical protein